MSMDKKLEIKATPEIKAPGCCGNTTGCCEPGAEKDKGAAQDVRDSVRQGYAKIAQTGSLTSLVLPQGGGCCGTSPVSAQELARKIGYSVEQLNALPTGANMGLSCGNPMQIAALKEGQVVLDLGSGGGFDVFLAGPKVGAGGRVIGVDMTSEMISKARKNIAAYEKNTGLSNVEFRLGEIEHLPVADASVDVVISNCVINLSPDKPQVWREIARVLKPGGRVAVSDMALTQALPADVGAMIEALVGCVAGAVLVEEYREMVARSGLKHVTLTPKPEYVAALSSFQDPLYAKIVEALPQGATAADYITSLDVTATKG
jgi:arsenite methyltransferase